MKAFEELVEEVYQDGDLRLEFVKYVQLRRKRQERIRQLKAQTPPEQNLRFLSYDEISQTGPDLAPEVVSLQQGLTILSSSLFKTLSLRYALAAETVHLLREAVVIRYEKTL